VQAGVRLGIVMKEKDVFHVVVRTDSTDVLLWFVDSFLVLLVMCSKDEAVYFSTSVYSVLPKVGKSVLKMTDTSSKNSLIIAKDVRVIHVNFIVIATTFLGGIGGITFVPPLTHCPSQFLNLPRELTFI
jgi:hypothetical protein